MSRLLAKKGAEEAYKHINTLFGELVDMQILLKNKRVSENIPEVVKDELLKLLQHAENECKKSYDWLCALKE